MFSRKHSKSDVRHDGCATLYNELVECGRANVHAWHDKWNQVSSPAAAVRRRRQYEIVLIVDIIL